MTLLKINTDKKMNEISPLLYGAFFEDINYGGDGGLYGELIANRSFEYYDRDNVIDKHKMCWDALIGTDFRICTERPINNIHTHYAYISGGAGCGIRNTGYCGEGFATDENASFIFSCYARASKNIKISIVITDRTGMICGHSEFMCNSREWQQYEFEIITDIKCKNAYLSVILPDGGNVDLEFISLFPKDSFLGRRNGMRKDIAEAIADMKPKFLRFPGGCIVEGRQFENMYNWKDTIGPVEERRTNWNRWQMEEYQRNGRSSADYFQSYGTGFYEYFQFCEDIGAVPIPVINCGMTCQWHEGLLVDLDKLDPFIQDALDLIEFANGDETSAWGRKRIEMGHTEPFNLEYIGIGNEQWGNEYFKRYELFQKIINEKYPDIKLITSAGWKDRGRDYDLAYTWMNNNKDKAYAVDEHFYKEPEWFLENINRYDNYDRSLPKVFVGEYAAHSSGDVNKRENNWYTALSEAAFLTGVEHNADHVIMTCYAPLLAKSNHQQWQPNLIWFDNENVYTTPNYYIQKLFSEYTGEYMVSHECDDCDIKISASMSDGKLFIKIINISGEDKEICLCTDKEFKLKKAVEIHAEPGAETVNVNDALEKSNNDNSYVIPGYGVVCIKMLHTCNINET